MADVGHFGCRKFTFDRISGHFRSISHFGFPKFTFNSGHFRSIQNFFFRRPFWKSENHFGSHFWPFQIDRPFWMSEVPALKVKTITIITPRLFIVQVIRRKHIKPHHTIHINQLSIKSNDIMTPLGNFSG